MDIRDFDRPWEIRSVRSGGARSTRCGTRAERLAERAAARRSDERLPSTRILEPLIAYVANVRDQEALQSRRDYDAIEHGLPAVKLGNRKGRGGAYGDAVPREELLAERESLRSGRRRVQAARGSRPARPASRGSCTRVVARYQETKSRRGEVDFLDLLIRTRNLLRDQAGRPPGAATPPHPPVRRRVPGHGPAAGGDPPAPRRPTIPDAERLASAFAPVPGKLFVVADPKQSISTASGRADVALYQRVKKQLLASGATPGLPDRELPLGAGAPVPGERDDVSSR